VRRLANRSSACAAVTLWLTRSWATRAFNPRVLFASFPITVALARGEEEAFSQVSFSSLWNAVSKYTPRGTRMAFMPDAKFAEDPETFRATKANFCSPM